MPLPCSKAMKQRQLMKRRDFLSGVGKLALTASASRWTRAAGAPGSPQMTLAAVGDCLVTRGFARNDPKFQPLLSILRGADVCFGNFEMTLPDPGMYPVATGSCGDLNNSAEGPVAEELRWAGFNIMSVANNHSMDYGVEGMFATAKKIGAAGISHGGTGRNLEEARAPAFFDSPRGRAALVACASTIRPGSAASHGNGEIPGRPGLSPLRFHTTYRVEAAQFEALRKIQQQLFSGAARALIEPQKTEGINFLGSQFISGAPSDTLTTPLPQDVAEISSSIRRAKRNAALVLVSIHAHEAHGAQEIPANFLKEFARACIDAGADVFLGHGPHLLRAIELYKRKPIFYSLGNFIFEAEGMRQIPQEIYEACGIAGNDPSEFFDRAMRGFADGVFWESVVATAKFERGDLVELKLYPVDLQPGLSRAERGMPIRADAEKSRAILERLSKLSASFGTTIESEGEVGVVRL